jgi:hypothetical protein
VDIEDDVSHAPRPRFGIALISAAALAYEVLLVALFSLTQWHHFAYMVVSIALLGFGISGSLLVFIAPRFAGRFRGFALAQAVAFALASVAAFVLAQRLAFNPEELIWDPRHWLRLGGVMLLLCLPFLFAANLIGFALIEYRDRLSRVYAADLLGAGIGAVAIVGLMLLMPPSRALLLVAMLGLGAAASLWIECGGRARQALPALVLAGFALHLTPAPWIEPVISPYKELSQTLRMAGTSIVAERFGPLGQLSVVESPLQPLRHAPGLSLNADSEPPEQLGLFTNAGGMSAITRYRGERPTLAYLDDMTAALPYHLLQPRNVLVLGAGGGDDVLRALYHGVTQVDAVELNADVIELLRGPFAAFSGGIYARDGVHVHIADARGFLRADARRYDLIQVPPLDSWGGAAGGVLGLNENYVYTVEALRDALASLEPNGYLALTRWVRLPPRDGLKLFATAIDAIEMQGGDAARQLFLIRGLQTSTLLVKNGAASAADIERLKAFCRSRSFDLAYYPGMPATEANRFNRLDEPYFHDAARALLSEERDRFMRQYKFDLRPASDDRPFYFHFVKLRELPELLQLRHRGGGALLETGYLTLLVTLALALVLGLVLILLPLFIGRRDTAGAAADFAAGRLLTYFATLGLGFLLIEIAFVQKFILLLQHPVYAAAVVLASFLLAAGAGSALAQRFAGSLRARQAASHAVLGIVLLGCAYLLLLDPVISVAADWPLTARLALAVTLIAPLGFCMGMPFPLGLAALAIGRPRLTPWAWGINGCASVASAVLATLIAIHFGFSRVILVALLCYLAAAASFPVPRLAASRQLC